MGRLKCMDIYFALMLRIAYKSSKTNIHTLQADNGEDPARLTHDSLARKATDIHAGKQAGDAAQALYAAAAADQPE